MKDLPNSSTKKNRRDCRYQRRVRQRWGKRGPYLGVGPGAHSYDGVIRQCNVAHNQRYIDSLQQRMVPCTVEILSRKDHINEHVMTGLRTRWGCDMAWLQTQYGYALQQTKSTYLEKLIDRKLAVIYDQKLQVTQQGKLLADQIAMDLFVD